MPHALHGGMKAVKAVAKTYCFQHTLLVVALNRFCNAVRFGTNTDLVFMILLRGILFANLIVKHIQPTM